MAAGLQERLPADEIVSIYEEKKALVMKIIEEAINKIPKRRSCNCREAIEKGKIG